MSHGQRGKSVLKDIVAKRKSGSQAGGKINAWLPGVGVAIHEGVGLRGVVMTDVMVE